MKKLSELIFFILMISAMVAFQSCDDEDSGPDEEKISSNRK